QMANVRFHRADGAEIFLHGACAKRLGQRGHLNRISQRRPRAMRLDVTDGFRFNAGESLRRLDDLRLRIDARGREAHLSRAIVVDGGAFNNSDYLVAVGDGLLQPLQHNGSGAVAAYDPLRSGVEGAAVSVRRGHAAFAVEVSLHLGDADG